MVHDMFVCGCRPVRLYALVADFLATPRRCGISSSVTPVWLAACSASRMMPPTCGTVGG